MKIDVYFAEWRDFPAESGSGKRWRMVATFDRLADVRRRLLALEPEHDADALREIGAYRAYFQPTLGDLWLVVPHAYAQGPGKRGRSELAQMSISLWSRGVPETGKGRPAET